jgi:hypothetical protein
VLESEQVLSLEGSSLVFASLALKYGCYFKAIISKKS